MRNLVLVASGGLAREVLSAVRAAGNHGRVLAVDDDPLRWGRSFAGVPVVGGIERVAGLLDSEIVVCAGRGRARRSLVERLARVGVTWEHYARIVHPSVEIPESCVVGRGSILLAHVSLTSDVRIGAHVVAMPQVTLTHDDVVADYATLCAGVSLGGNVTVGSGAYLGMNASVREGLRVGADTVLGMGAALLRPLPDGETWAGVPAAPLLASRRGQLAPQLTAEA
ncbi:acetyltransferase [Nocardioides sp. zg-DK7169]|uniref:acetyltransferase n=1 Tax=Nocardioides sp. zg-DK7169 TaxID=2736600 RepID=UPI0015564889|nr:acetyltransferase [Nocardioides sp. zg-DK7169]NPC97946.1 acetyltransferase [Nocardioides sp. zg-DK7169]